MLVPRYPTTIFVCLQRMFIQQLMLRTKTSRSVTVTFKLDEMINNNADVPIDSTSVAWIREGSNYVKFVYLSSGFFLFFIFIFFFFYFFFIFFLFFFFFIFFFIFFFFFGLLVFLFFFFLG